MDSPITTTTTTTTLIYCTLWKRWWLKLDCVLVDGSIWMHLTWRHWVPPPLVSQTGVLFGSASWDCYGNHLQLGSDSRGDKTKATEVTNLMSFISSGILSPCNNVLTTTSLIFVNRQFQTQLGGWLNIGVSFNCQHNRGENSGVDYFCLHCLIVCKDIIWRVWQEIPKSTENPF